MLDKQHRVLNIITVNMAASFRRTIVKLVLLQESSRSVRFVIKKTVVRVVSKYLPSQLLRQERVIMLSNVIQHSREFNGRTWLAS